MVSFIVYDVIFLVLFTLAVVLFLYKRRHNLKRQGLLYLYRTSFGLKVIDWTAKKFERILRPLQYVVITSGYVLMVGIIWFTVKVVILYTRPDIIRAIKVPPIIPLFPYLPSVFKLDFLPPFYFTYWIIIIAIIAISHEFAHGIFARLNNIKVHSTGFGFLGPFLAAFVEPDEKHMNKAKKFPQLSILAAGTFANVIMTILFALILWIFFMTSFVPAGVNFNAYPNAVVNLNDIKSVSGNLIDNINDIPEFAKEEDELTEIVVILKEDPSRYQEETFFAPSEMKFLVPGDNLRQAVEKGIENVVVFEDAPAIKAGLKGPILAINGFPVVDQNELREELIKYEPGEVIKITTIENEEKKEIELELGEKDNKAYLGIKFNPYNRKGIIGFIFGIVTKVKNPLVYYEPIWGSNFAWFVYNLLWWIVLINLSVALINMLPVGIFDGGRFFYLTVWGITRSEKFGRNLFALATWAIIVVLIWLMLQWALAVF